VLDDGTLVELDSEDGRLLLAGTLWMDESLKVLSGDGDEYFDSIDAGGIGGFTGVDRPRGSSLMAGEAGGTLRVVSVALGVATGKLPMLLGAGVAGRAEVAELGIVPTVLVALAGMLGLVPMPPVRWTEVAL
jgi:hypothetical protein